MKIRWHGMLGKNHSWAFTQQSLIKPMINSKKHEIFLKSTNGLEHFPKNLESYLVPGYHTTPGQKEKIFYLKDNKIITLDKPSLQEVPDINRPYDLELAYTIFLQAPRRFYKETPVKMIIWNFESSILPPGWHLYHKAIDYFLPSSQFSADIFINNGVPKEKCIVVPHGVDQTLFNPEIKPFKFKTDKKVKFLHMAIPHHRKLHDRVINGYLDAFTGNDDVCLILKTQLKIPEKTKPFEVDVREIIKKALKGRKNPAQIEVVQTFVDNIGSLYVAADAVVSMSSTEGFNLTLLESLACGTPVIAPRYGGQLDFLNDKNSMLVDTNIMKAPPSMQYWSFHPDAVVGDPNTRHFSELLRKFYESPQTEKNRIEKERVKTVNAFNWERASEMIIDLAKETLERKMGPHLPKKKKVMYVIPYPMFGGGEVWVKEAISRLDKNIYEPIIVCPLGVHPRLADIFDGLRIEDLKEQGNGAALKILIESEKPYIVHFYNSFQVYNVIIQTLKDGGWRNHVVETVHSKLKWKDSMMRVGKRKGVSMIISVSQDMKNHLNKLGNNNVIVMPQQVDWDRFKIEKNKDILKSFGISKNDFVVGVVARLSPEKNIQSILSCAKQMPEKKFVIVGNGPQKDILESFSADNVIFVGHQKNVEDFYAAFDILLISSIMEGLPLVALEAMTAGLPIIAPKIGAISEILQTGHNGVLINDSSPNGLYSGLKYLEKLDLKVLSENSKKLAKQIKNAGLNTDINKLYSLLK